MKSPSSNPDRVRGDGCGFLIATCVFTCLMLIVNGVVVTTLFQWSFPDGPPQSLQKIKLVQIVLFVGPVLLLFVEWTLLDFVLRRMVFGRRV
jgi:hypothetical protein